MKHLKTRHYSWAFLLLTGYLVGCHDQKKDINEISQPEALALIEHHFTKNCVGVKTDMVGGIQFNTLTKIPGNTPEDKWTTLPDREIISIPADAAETRKSQINWLVQQGIVEKINDTIYLGRGRISGYYHQAIDYKKGDKKGEWTYEDKGSQYTLTRKGYQQISQKDRPALAFCIGQWTISNVVLYKGLASATDKVKVTFKASLVNVPDWVPQKETRDVFPYVAQQWRYKKIPEDYTTYIKIVNGRYVVENDQFIRTAKQ